MTEHYPTLIEMAPWHKTYPITRTDGWNIFRGPKLGSMAPDWYVVARSNEPKVFFSSLLQEAFATGYEYVVVLFDGLDHGDTTSELKELSDTLEHLDEKKIDVLIVTRFYDSMQYDVMDNIISDIDLTLEKKYKASWQSVYVIDKEWKIVYKSAGIMKDKLSYFLFQLVN